MRRLASFTALLLLAAPFLAFLAEPPALASGPVVGWGGNEYRQATPPPTVGGTADAIAAGASHTCAIQAGTGQVVCWGLDDEGQATPPAEVDGTTGTASAVATGGYHSLAIREDDGDGDGIPHLLDNCTAVANGPLAGPGYVGGVQLDGNQDGYGNPCDMDFSNDGLHTGADVTPFIAAIGASDPRADINCDGLATGADVGPGIGVLGASPAPGPSGLSCAGTIPCP